MTVDDLSKLAMWEDWQDIVKRSLPNFAASPIYVQQRSQTDEDFERCAEYVAGLSKLYDHGKLRDVQWGGLARNTKACGKVTRMWLDSNVECDFLHRHVPEMHNKNVLDIGAGYGRLAVALSKHTKSYTCVDAVPISTEVCREYVKIHAPSVQVPALKEFLDSSDLLCIDLAINIHSWNECSIEQIANWLALLKKMNVAYLFTVSNGSVIKGKQAYASWGGSGESFRPLLENQYHLVAEESIGLSLHPHALWKLK